MSSLRSLSFSVTHSTSRHTIAAGPAPHVADSLFRSERERELEEDFPPETDLMRNIVCPINRLTKGPQKNPSFISLSSVAPLSAPPAETAHRLPVSGFTDKSPRPFFALPLRTGPSPVQKPTSKLLGLEEGRKERETKKEARRVNFFFPTRGHVPRSRGPTPPPDFPCAA